MTISLANAGQRFNSHFYTAQGLRFAGTLLPASETSPAKTEFFSVTSILRVAPNCPVTSGTAISDIMGQLYLMADHEEALVSNLPLYRTHKLLRVSHNPAWTRPLTTMDALTGLKKGNGLQEMGHIPCLIEPLREGDRAVIGVADEVHRVITNVELQLNDLIDKRVVKGVSKRLGLWVAEVQ